MQLPQAKRGSFRDTLYWKVKQHFAGKQDELAKEGMDLLRRSAETNSRDRKALEHIEELLNTKIDKEDL